MPRPLTIFIYEHLTGGACREVPLDSSLMTEGRAMADAVIADFTSLAELQVVTVRDDRLPAVDHPQVATHTIAETEQESEVFENLCATADRVLIVAPETDGILTQRIEQARRVNPAGVLNCGNDALRIGCDKWQLFQWLTVCDIPNIPTRLGDAQQQEFESPVIIKPRDGAGCEGLRIVRDHLEGSLATAEFIVQPFLEGVALSSAACFSADGRRLLTLPVGQQQLDFDHTIAYRGGKLPWQDERCQEAERQAELVWQKLEMNLPGLCGYVGIDWLWHEQTESLLLVEINPRLTTAYVGYRELFGTRIVQSLLGRSTTDIIPDSSAVGFFADGRLKSLISRETAS